MPDLGLDHLADLLLQRHAGQEALDLRVQGRVDRHPALNPGPRHRCHDVVLRSRHRPAPAGLQGKEARQRDETHEGKLARHGIDPDRVKVNR